MEEHIKYACPCSSLKMWKLKQYSIISATQQYILKCYMVTKKIAMMCLSAFQKASNCWNHIWDTL